MKRQNENEPTEPTSLLQRLKKRNKISYIPDSIKNDTFILSTDFHPEQDLIATGEILGEVQVWKYHKDGNKVKKSYKKVHTDSCRAVKWNLDGSKLFSVSKDCSIGVLDIESNKNSFKMTDAHEHGINALCVYNENLFVTGSDSGEIKIWDIREKNSIDSFRVNGDYISQIDYYPEIGRIYAGSGDGCLTTYDIDTKKLLSVAKTLDDDILSVLVMEDFNTVLCGTISGKIHVYNAHESYKSNTALKTERESVDTMALIRDNTIAVGSSEGEIDIYKIEPKRYISKLASHDAAISKLSLSRDGMFLASCGDETVKFWDVGFYFNIQVEEEGKKSIRSNSERNRFFSGFKDQ